MDKEELFLTLEKESEYALSSKSKSLAYQTYGSALMAYRLGAITKEQFYGLNEMLVKKGLNNPKAGLV